MFIFYNPDTLKVINIITITPDNYRAFLETQPNQHWVETQEDFSFDEIEVMPDKSLRRRQSMTLTYPATVQVGVEFAISGVPEGVTIVVNSAAEGVMDVSGALEFTAGVGGFYKFRFEGPGYIAKEIEIEAQS